MWAKVEDGEVTEIILYPKVIVVNEITHPRAIFSSWTDADRLNIGIYPVTAAEKLDKRFYVSKEPTYAISGTKVIETIEKSADNDLDETKAQAKLVANEDAHLLLIKFEWLIQRKVTADTAIPSDVLTYMAAIRTDHKAICDAIDGASDMDALVALHKNTYKTVDGKQVVDVVARVNRWTDDSDVKGHRR